MTYPIFDPRNTAAEIGQFGLLRPTRFHVRVGLPPALRGQFSQTNRESLLQVQKGMISMWCESANLPAVALRTHSVRRWGYGPTEEKPVEPKFDDVQLVIRSDASGHVFSFLQAWMRVANHYDYRSTITGRTGPVPGQHPFELTYKEDYAQDVVITQFDDAGQPQLFVTLREAFPVFIDAIPLSWSAINDYSRVACKLTFVSWYDDRPVIAIDNTTGPNRMVKRDE